MRLSDFLIIGAAKSGTTTLYQYLTEHPQVYLSPIKEPMFFAVDNTYAQGLEWYSSLFAEAQPHQICGEASTDYTKYPQYPETAARIAKTIPNVKMIYIMRHPVDRAYAYYIHLHRSRNFKKFELTFEEHIQRTSVSIDISNYMMQIEQYLQFFSKESFLFLLMEDLINEPQQTLQKVCQFLGIDDSPEWIPETPIVTNDRQSWINHVIRKEIVNPLKSNPILKPIITLVPEPWRDWLYKKILSRSSYAKEVNSRYTPIPMLSETRQMLLEKFRTSNDKLADFIGRDLSHWSE